MGRWTEDSAGKVGGCRIQPVKSECVLLLLLVVVIAARDDRRLMVGTCGLLVVEKARLLRLLNAVVTDAGARILGAPHSVTES